MPGSTTRSPAIVPSSASPRPQRGVRGDAAADHERGDARGLGDLRAAWSTSTSTTAAWNDAATSATSTSGCLRTYCTTAVLRPENEKSLPSSSIGRGNAIAVGIAAAREAVDRGTARIPEAEEPRDLVERLARRVVDGLAEHAVLAVIVHRDEQRVTARHDERDERRLELGILEQRRVHVRFVMVHAHVRAAGRER